MREMFSAATTMQMYHEHGDDDTRKMISVKQFNDLKGREKKLFDLFKG